MCRHAPLQHRSLSRSNRLDRPRLAFTLVELLVVITIIGILMSLLIPVVGRVREMAHRVACMNNQTQIGMATQLYATSKGHMPPELSEFTETVGVAGVAPMYVLGWAENLMAQLGRPDLSPGTLAVGTLRSKLPNVSVLVCPSDPTKSGASGGPLSYVVNGGCPNNYSPTAGQPVDSSANGAWNYSVGTTASPSNGVLASSTTFSTTANTNITLEYIGKHDGTGMTISTSENNDATTYSYGNYSVGNLQQSESSQAILWCPGQTGTGNANPIGYYPTGVTPQAGRINQGSSSSSNVGYYNLARPSSNHPGGAVFGFCDGSVKFIQSTLGYNIYVSMMTSNALLVTQPGFAYAANNTYWGLQEIPLDSSQIPSN